MAKLDGVSLHQRIGSAVARKIRAVRTTAELSRLRADGADGERPRDFLGRVPDRAPDPRDELPPE